MTNGQEVNQAPQPQQEPQDAVQEAPKQEVPAAPKIEVPKKVKKEKEVNMDVLMIKETLINYIVPIISILVAVLIGVFVLMPAYKSIPELNADIEEKSRLEVTLKGKLSNMNRLLEFQAVVQENSDLVSRVLVSEELVPGLLTQIDRIARESGLTVSNLNYGLGKSKKGDTETQYNTVTVNLGAEGSFSQLKTFMENIEKAARIIIVDNYRYSSNLRDAGNKVGVNFVLISPYLFVESDAVTDGPIDLDIADEEFQTLINKIKGLKYYNPYEVDITVPVVEAPEEETEEAETTEDTVLEGGGEEVVIETTETPIEVTEESVFGN